MSQEYVYQVATEVIKCKIKRRSHSSFVHDYFVGVTKCTYFLIT